MINKQIEIEELLEKAAYSIYEKKGENITSMKFSEKQSNICDYFLICESSNTKHAQAICDFLRRTLRTELKTRPEHIEGYDTANWILLDYWDIIIHIFSKDARNFYGLEKLWSDTEIKKINFKTDGKKQL